VSRDRLRRAIDGAQDALVRTAAAHVLRESLADLAFAWPCMACEERRHGHHKAGDAVAALHRRLIDEGLLDRMQCAVAGEPFDRRDRPARYGADRRHTRAQWLAIDDHRAGAAEPLAAAVLRAGEAGIEADEAEQVAGRIGRLVRLAVDVD